MKNHLKSIFRYPLFLFLLPVYFAWHGYVEFYDLVNPLQAILIAIKYLFATLVLYGLFKVIFRNWRKAALFTFPIMAINLFFGTYQDWIENIAPESFFTRYVFILPLIIISLIILFYWLKKAKTGFVQCWHYLNALLPILLMTDLLLLCFYNHKEEKIGFNIDEIQPSVTSNQIKPDVYFILTDGYTGNIPLQKFFAYENSGFTNNLKERGFMVVDSSFSNYEYTIFSMGSMLNMNYLNINNYFKGNRDLAIAFNAIKKSHVLRVFKKMGYRIVNNSMFDAGGESAALQKFLVKFEKSPITTQTLLYRAKKDIGYHILQIFPFLETKNKHDIFTELKNNILADSLTRKLIYSSETIPNFIYTHLTMPHTPYFFDSSGRATPAENLTSSIFHSNKEAYISYLKYSNKKLLSLIDEILTKSSRPPIIILTSDHGSRECLNKSEEIKYQHMNLMALFTPDKNYMGYYKGLSNVNFFRIFFNNQFGTNFKLLKDSVTYINPNKEDLH